jgi:hypothetical protein
MKTRYLMITFVRKPNGQIDEMVTISKRVKASDTQMANIILDFKERKIIKCVIESEVVNTNWDMLTEYYKKVYPVLFSQLEKEFAESTE